MPLFVDRLLAHRGALKVDLSDGYYLAKDNRTLIMLVKPTHPSQDLAFSRKLLDAARETRDAVRAALAADGAGGGDRSALRRQSGGADRGVGAAQAHGRHQRRRRRSSRSSLLYWICYRRFAALLYSSRAAARRAGDDVRGRGDRAREPELRLGVAPGPADGAGDRLHDPDVRALRRRSVRPARPSRRRPSGWWARRGSACSRARSPPRERSTRCASAASAACAIWASSSEPASSSARVAILFLLPAMIAVERRRPEAPGRQGQEAPPPVAGLGAPHHALGRGTAASRSRGIAALTIAARRAGA